VLGGENPVDKWRGDGVKWGMSSLPRRYFLDWNKPLLEPLCAWMLERRDALPGMLVVVPTGQSGRRLREALAEASGGAVLGPRCVTPDWFLGSRQRRPGSRAGVMIAWVELLKGLRLESFPHLFPVPPPAQTFAWALQVGGLFEQVREKLAEGDHGIEDVLAMEHAGNRERWRELQRLEASLLERIDKVGGEDPVSAKRQHATEASLPPAINHIVVACVPDPVPLVRKAWERHLTAGIEVSVIVHAPESEAETFSAWGEPLSRHWCSRPLALEGWKERVQVVRDAAEAGRACVDNVAANQTPAENLAVAMCSLGYVSSVAQAFDQAGWKTFNPEGRPVLATGIGDFLRALEGCLADHVEFSAVSALLRSPLGRRILGLDAMGHASARALDELAMAGLPRGFDDARRLAGRWADIDKDCNARHAKARRGHGIRMGTEFKALADFLRNLNKNKERLWRELVALQGEMVESVGELWGQAVLEVAAAMERQEVLGGSEGVVLLREVLAAGRFAEREEEASLDLQGWLELSYDPAPHVLMVGFHEGCVPEGSGDDPFLADVLREELGLRSRAFRHGRDAFLLAGEWASRQRVDVIVSKMGPSGESEKPSRLLLQCAEDELPGRVLHVFEGKNDAGRSVPSWQRDWQLRLPAESLPMRYDRPLSPTAIRDYLLCPTRFYAKRVLKMQREETGGYEMDARGVGNLCHEVLEVFGRDESMVGCEDVGRIVVALDGILDGRVREVFGAQPGLPVWVQVHSVRERLHQFARWQAATVAEGWRMVAVEYDVGADGGFEIGGHPFRFTIDRIDYHAGEKAWRVLDYKTRATAKKPEKVHLLPARAEDAPWHLGALVPPSGRERSERAWADVQLPLYAEGVRRLFSGGELPCVGYFQLPQALSETDYVPWQGFDEQLMESALEWTVAAVARIREGVFWPPRDLRNKPFAYDDFEGLAPDGLLAAVEEPKMEVGR